VRFLSRLAVIVGTVFVVVGVRAYHVATRGPVSGVLPFALLAAVLIVFALSLGIPDEPDDTSTVVVRSCVASIAAAAFVALVLTVSPGWLPRFVVLVSAVAAVPVFVGASLLHRALVRRHRIRERVVAVLSDTEGLLFEGDVHVNFPLPEKPFTVVAVLDLDSASSDGLIDTATALDATLLVLGDVAARSEIVLSQAAALHRRGLRVRSLSGFYDEWLGKLPLSELSQLALMTDISSVHGARFGFFKRIADVFAGLAGFLLFCVILPFVVLGNLVANRGPLLFRQRRVGLGGRVFVIYKLRTMRNSDGEDDSSWTSPADPRVTPFGYILRRTHLDEVPQFVNMLAGTLSLVGPRPEQPRYVAELTTKVPLYEVRHVVKPGLTGWAQIKFRYAATEADALEKLQYDLHYIRHQSVTVDVKIVGRTIRSVLLARGR
jgi:lipopolysaccharide/colanic/teichoic acid biosynthesis glycosyltransferase